MKPNKEAAKKKLKEKMSAMIEGESRPEYFPVQKAQNAEMRARKITAREDYDRVNVGDKYPQFHEYPEMKMKKKVKVKAN